MIRHAMISTALLLGIILVLTEPSTTVGDDSGISPQASKKADVAKIYGKIQFVKAFPDYKVQIVNAFPDLKVKIVTAFPDKAGKWKIVTAFPDYKIQIVTAFPDFKVKYVDAFPGLP